MATVSPGDETEMLIIVRDVGQTINIGDDVEVVLLAIDEKVARIGVSAPRNIPINRKELHPIGASRYALTGDGKESPPPATKTSTLILVRAVGQAITIGDNIEIMVLDLTDGKTVRLGIEAPRQVEITRGELDGIVPSKNKEDESSRQRTSMGPSTSKRTRRVVRVMGSGLRFNDEISFRVHNISETEVGLGITAPRDVNIHREEITRRNTNPYLASTRAKFEKGGSSGDPHRVGTLILTRKLGQTVNIGNDISITVVAINGEQTVLDITGPTVIMYDIGKQIEMEQKQTEYAGESSGIGHKSA